jgi:uncharacterized membrane protein
MGPVDGRPGDGQRSLLRDERGAVGIVAALAAPVLVGIVALGVEVGLWYAVKREAQTAADSAAIAAARAVASGQGAVGPVGLDSAARNGFVPAVDTVVVILSPPESGISPIAARGAILVE